MRQPALSSCVAQLVTKYYFTGGQVVALRQGGVLSYLFSDHLPLQGASRGSTTVTTDSSGTKTAEMRYKPCPQGVLRDPQGVLRDPQGVLREGETRYTSGTTPTAKHYTSQYEESGIGLYFYNARWYDPLLGRFAQADTLIPQPGSPMAWDRYGYVMNNPVKYNDPTGHCIGPLLYFCILGGLYVADHIAIIGAVALTGAVLSYVGNSAPDMELVNDKAASQVEFENRTAQSQAWLLLYGGARIVADITSPPATTALSKETSANPVTPRSETSNYTKVEYQGRNIYQRNDIDWDYIDPKRGFTNRELAANGNAPFGPDRKPINLHHLLQQEPGPMAEVPATVHQRGQKILHGLLEDGQSFRNIPGLENQYNQFRKNYWEWRATNLE